MKARRLVERHLLLLLIVSSGLALWWPQLTSGWPDPFTATKAWVPWLVAATMFLIGWMLPVKQVDEVLRHWPLVVGGTALQYVSMPLLAAAAAWLFRLRGPDYAGIMLVGAVPGAMASNVLTLNARGNVSYSVSLTTSATLLSPLVVPLVLWLALGSLLGPEPRDVFFTLLSRVVAPVVTGHLLRRYWPRSSGWGDGIGPVAANLTILWIVAIVVALRREEMAAASLTLLAPLTAVNLAGYAAGFWGAGLLRLPEDMRKALTLEIGMQNAGVGTMLALALFEDSSTAIAPALYTFGCMLTGTVLARWWGRRVY